MSEFQWRQGEAFKATTPSGVMYRAEYDGRRFEIHRAEVQDMYRGVPCSYRYWLTVDGVSRGSKEKMLSAVKAQAHAMVAWSELSKSIQTQVPA